MNEKDVARAVREVSLELVPEKASQPYDSWVVNPMAVWNALQRRRPDVARHIAKRYAGDPYQNVKRWVPERTTG